MSHSMDVSGWGHQASSNAERNSGPGLFLAPPTTPPGRLPYLANQASPAGSAHIVLSISMGTVWCWFPHPSHCPSPCWLLSQGSSLYLNCQLKFLLKIHTHTWEFPCSSVVKAQYFHCCSLGSIPGWETKILGMWCSGGEKSQQKWEFLFNRCRVTHLGDLKRKKLNGVQRTPGASLVAPQ